jgi:hypothetical protein
LVILILQFWCIVKFKDFSSEETRIRQRGWDWFFFFFFPGRVLVWRIRHLGIRRVRVGNFEALPRFSELEKTGGMISWAAYCEFFCVTTILWVPKAWDLTENAFHVFTATLWKVVHDPDPQFKWMGASYRPQEYKLEFVAGLVF